MTDNLKQITNRWKLPKSYLDFLQNNDNDITIEVENEDGIPMEVRLYGSSDLINNQEGYSYNPFTKKVIDVWPENYVVIADSDADPFVLDLSQSDGNDAPILYAFHGEGSWSFEKHSETFNEFLKEKLNVN